MEIKLENDSDKIFDSLRNVNRERITRERAILALDKAKEEESKRRGKMVEIKLPRGMIMTTNPEKYEAYIRKSDARAAAKGCCGVDS